MNIGDVNVKAGEKGRNRFRGVEALLEKILDVRRRKKDFLLHLQVSFTILQLCRILTDLNIIIPASTSLTGYALLLVVIVMFSEQ
jgi:hypothetical protein